jgi:hypothetical protein
MNAILREQNHDELAELCQTSALKISYITVFLQAVAGQRTLRLSEARVAHNSARRRAVTSGAASSASAMLLRDGHHTKERKSYCYSPCHRRFDR